MLLQERFHEAVHVYGSYAVKAEIEMLISDEQYQLAYDSAKALKLPELAEIAKSALDSQVEPPKVQKGKRRKFLWW